MQTISTIRVQRRFLRADAAERALCLRINRWSRQPGVRRTFAVAGRLGDGVAWYALIIGIAVLGGSEGPAVALQMALTGLLGLTLYRCLKRHLVRERPFISHEAVVCVTAPLDRYSFPSGHTLHAVLFTVLIAAHYPLLGWLLVPLTLTIALSRVVLGLHYPTDVAAGAGVGAALAWLSECLREPMTTSLLALAGLA
jgi:undecaprenyl-diphosphatase